MLTTPWPVIGGALMLTAAGFAGGYALKGRLDAAEHERLRGEMARMEAAHAAEKQAAAEAAAQRLAAAEAAEAEAVRALHATRQRLTAADRRLKESLYALPTADRCGLSDTARGLLNARLAASHTLPARAAGPDGADAALAADPGEPSGTTEADLGAWIADAIRAYDECRARIDAIRHWDEVTHGR